MTKAIPFIDRALTVMNEGLYNDHKTVTGEQVRFWLKSKRVKSPDKTNLYGTLISRAINLGLLKRTDKFVTMETPTSGGKKRRLYTVSKKKIELNG
jgi:hypothetical protein